MSATVLPTSSPPTLLPPSSRDFEVFRFLSVHGGSTREAARAFGLSQTRVRQIARRVAEWEAQVLPEDSEMGRAQALRVSEHLAADRLQHLYEQSMSMWRGTQQPKYMGLALRVILAQSKVSAWSHTMEALVADANEGPLEELEEYRAEAAEGFAADTYEDEGEGEDEVEKTSAAESAANHSPDRDCSPASVPLARPVSSADDRVAATPRPSSRLQQLGVGSAWQTHEREERVRTLLSQPDSAALAGVSATAESLGLNVDDALAKSRRLRRKAR